MRVLKKIVAFLLLVLLTVAGFIVKVVVRLGSMVAGLATLFLGICAFLALINKMWLQLEIFGIIFAVMMICLFASAELQVQIELATERLKRV